MSKELLIRQLRLGKTGNEILMILDALIKDNELDSEPTLDPIEF